MNYYRRYVGKYQKKTTRLSMLEHGAYNLLLDYYYVEEKPIPLDRAETYRMVRAMKKDEQNAIDKVIGLYFEPREDGYHNEPADAELGVAQTTIEAQRAAGANSAARRRSTGRSTDQLTEQSTSRSTARSADGLPVGLPVGLPGHPLNLNPSKTTTSPPPSPPSPGGVVDNSQGKRPRKPAKNNGSGQWWRSQQGIEREGRKRGLEARPGESSEQFADRIRDKIGASR